MRFVVAAVFLAAGLGWAQAPATGELEVLSYNVHGLPAPITGDDTLARLKAIGPKLEAFGVVGLQEDFLPDGHPLLDAGNRFPRRERFTDTLEGRVYGSGLACFARARVLEVYREPFRAFHGVLAAGSDGLASKGFLLVRLELRPGVELDVYVSHLDAGNAEEDAAARADQVRQVRESLETRSKGRAVVFLGDTNLKAKLPRDARTLASWLEASGLRCACLARRETCCGRIDRILIRGGAGLQLEVQDWGEAPGFTDGAGRPLSDHAPLRARLKWTQRAF